MSSHGKDKCILGVGGWTMRPLHKTVIVIWSKDDITGMELGEIERDNFHNSAFIGRYPLEGETALPQALRYISGSLPQPGLEDGMRADKDSMIFPDISLSIGEGPWQRDDPGCGCSHQSVHIRQPPDPGIQAGNPSWKRPAC